MNLKIFTLFFIITGFSGWSQTVQLQGELIGEGDLENIHIINTTSNRFTATNASGQFIMTAKYQDTIMVTSVRYKNIELLVTNQHIETKSIKIYLEEQINVLDDVIVGKILTGDLSSDLINSDAEAPLNFWDLGLPGYTGKPLTQNERRYFDAHNGKWFNGLSFNFYKFLNKVSGRTEKFKERVFLERKTLLTNAIKDRLQEDFFVVYPVPEEFKMEFWYFCSEDLNFESRCHNKSDMEIIEFLKEKHKAYIKNLEVHKD